MTIRELTKKALKSNPVGRMVYEPVHSIWKFYNNPRKRKRLQKYGDETIQRLHHFFKENGVEYYLDFGTLLGIVRENGFIRHDDDIDLTIRNSPISPKLLLKKLTMAGFDFVHGFHAEGRILEATIMWKGLTVDLFFGREDKSKPGGLVLYGCLYDPSVSYPAPNANTWRAAFFPISTRAIPYQFHGFEICVPSQTEDMLTIEYGPCWRTPIRNFEFKEEDHHYEYQKDFAYRELSIDDLPEEK